MNNYRSSKLIQIALSTFALASVILFAAWWFNPEHVPQNFEGNAKIIDIILFFLVSYVVWHPVIMDVITWFISLHIKDLRQQKPVPGLKVAFITTIVPGKEPLELLHKCLPAMIKAKYEHDTWLLDEGNNEEVKKICDQYGVKHFSRCGISEYNTKTGKFTKTKGGNHNSWYDCHGDNYDIVAQIDIDFVPKSNFLTKTLGYFRDSKVAFVGTPQIYGNTKKSLIAQGASEQQYGFYGAVLRGLSAIGMTLLIGANHVIRVSAFKKVDHYTAHITEDLITGIKLHASGWKSVYIPQPLAIGEGPSTWSAYFNQQARWAYGCIDIFFRYSLKQFKKMEFLQSLYYFFLQQHYFSGLAMALSVLLLSLYFLFGLRAANVDVIKFFILYSLIILICWLMSVWLQRYNIYRKKEGELLLAGKVISISAWPIWFLALINALIGRPMSYKVTPKGEKDVQEKKSLTIFIPHIFFGLVALIELTISFFTHRQSTVMMFWAFTSAALMLGVPFIQDIVRGLSKISGSFTNSLKNVYYNHLADKPVNIKVFYPALPDSQNSSQDKTVIKDTLFLSTVFIISFILYIGKLGFYSDDWSFLGNFNLSYDQSLIGLIRTATTPNTLMRPVQNIYDSLLYWLFGTQPLGYQLVNAAVLLAIILIFYFTLRQLKLPHLINVSAPLVYTLLPNYSTDRFWYAAFQVNISMLFYFFSLYAGLRAFSSNTRTALWEITSIFSLIISGLSYEVILPLVFLNIILFWNPIERFNRAKSDKHSLPENHTVFIIITFIVLMYIVLFKALTTIRLGKLNYPGDVIYILSSVFRESYITLGLKLPFIWSEILVRYQNPLIFVTGFMLFLIIFWYLHSISSQPTSDFPGRSWMRNLTFVSYIIFFLGYAIFFTNNKVGFSPTGVDNRIAIAGTVGVAFSIIGGIGWLSRLIFPEKLSRIFFCIFVTVICSGGFLIINTLASFWITAHEQQQIVLADIRSHFPFIYKGSTLILDGVCPYVGPGVVFESQWDLKGAIQTIYGDATLQADIVTPRLKVGNDGIHTQIYTFPQGYPYKNLYIYNYKQKKTYPIPDAQAARSYFQKFNPDYSNGCATAKAGHGVDVF